MKEDDIFPPWNDLDDGTESFWSASWFIDKDQDKDSIILTMTIDNKKTFDWFYPEVYNAYHTDTLKEFINRYYKEEISQYNLDEFKTFLTHWLQIVANDGAMDIAFADELVQEKDENFIEVTSKTLH